MEYDYDSEDDDGDDDDDNMMMRKNCYDQKFIINKIYLFTDKFTQ